MQSERAIMKWPAVGVATLVMAGIGAHPCVSVAHHSTAEYDVRKVVEARGRVVDVLWRNPHVRISVSTADIDQVTRHWMLEGMDVMRLDRAGVPRDLVEVGDTVRFAGNPSTRRERRMYLTNLLLEDGTEILLRSGAQPRWSERYLSSSQTVIDPARAAADRSSGIFRVWVPAGRNVPEWAADPPLTASARAAYEAYDPIRDDPMLGCGPPGMPRVISRSGGHPIRFTKRDGDIILQNEYFGLERVIQMGSSEHLHDRAPQPLGHSAGRWEHGSLVVTTTGIDWPLFDFYGMEGVPQSERMEIVERFTLSPGGRELIYDLAATDPETFVGTVIAEGYLTFRWRPGMEFLPYECVTDP
jgi:hypothetical protein